ncbi:MAG: hypothetical protein LAN18_01940 [Acidobacteriia bacterium]|nr:hypothetical protein [Terriglobia bacterium]
MSPLCPGLSFLFLVLLLLNIFLISCGGVASSAPVTVTVLPTSAQPFTGSTVPFTATVQNAGSSAITWQVNSIPGGDTTVGTINASGLFTAPNAVPNPPTVMVTAVLQSDSTKSGYANVTIQTPSPIQGPLSLSPALSSLTTSQTLQLQVTTAGVSNSQVNWAVNGGIITTDGFYTPPSSAGSFNVIVTLKANPSVTGSAQVKVTDFAGTFTWRNDNSRSGQNPKELALAPAAVSSSKFGKLFSCPLDGYAYAQPLYVANLAIPGKERHNVIFVATEKDTVFAFDADANPCLQLWHTGLIPAGEEPVQTPNSEITSADIAPFIGITGTPVIDSSSSTLYVVAETWTPGLNPVYDQRLYALDLATGQRKIQPSGVVISTAASVTPAFSPLWGNQRAALLLENGTVYIAFASHHDLGDYHGWLLGYDAATMQQTSAFDDTPGGQGGGIWQSGGGPSADSNHNAFVITGNGTFDANRGGSDYGDSFLRLSSTSGLAVTDYFTPCDQAALASADQYLGSSAPLLLPDGIGPPSYPNLLLGAAMNGSMYLVDREALGGYDGGICPDIPPRPVQKVPVGDGPILSTPVYWNNAIYIAAGSGKLKAFPMTGGVLQSTPSSQSPETLGLQGATPVVSSNGANNAIVWLIDTSGAQVTPYTPAIIRAFDATNLSNELYNSAMMPTRDSAGLAVKFTVPTEANSKVYVGTQTELDVYGLLH